MGGINLEIQTDLSIVISTHKMIHLIIILLDRPKFPHRMLIIGWWYSIPEQQLQGH